MSEKLQKVLARAGLGSRRGMEELISSGRVSVNGTVAELGSRVEDKDEVRVDGRRVHFQTEEDIKKRIILYYKPEGEICSSNDPEGRPTPFEKLPNISRSRWVMVGRLDINSSGLLVFTNDGELANQLMHPSTEIERQYAVRVMGEVTPQIVKALTTGVDLEDGRAKFESFSELGGEGINRWYQVVVKEGRNREVRRLFESQGLKVSRLLRTRYGNIQLPRELRTGQWAELNKEEVANVDTYIKQQLKTLKKQRSGIVEDEVVQSTKYTKPKIDDRSPQKKQFLANKARADKDPNKAYFFEREAPKKSRPSLQRSRTR